jgi:metallo-beta-lactamase class B
MTMPRAEQMFKKMSKPLVGTALAGLAATLVFAQTKVWTPQELFTRNIGTKESQRTAFPPHKIIGNIYYVGTQTLASFLVVTPEGNVLIDSTYEGNVPIIRKSIEDLGFKFSDTKILLGSHAHGDHQEGDAMVKELTGAKVMAMAEDVPALEAMKPGGKPHPIDRVLHDGDQVTLGGTTLVAHLTPGHTHGDTTWSLKAQENGKTYDVVIIGSMGVNPGAKLINNAQNPNVVAEYEQGFKVMHSLPCDVPLGSHPAMYNIDAKYAKLKAMAKGDKNPFIDPEGYKSEVAIEEGAYRGLLEQQQKAAAEK